MRTFTQQIAKKGPVTRAFVSVAVIAGYGVGTVRAHTDPAIKAVGKKLRELTPEGLLMACHAFHEGIDLGKSEELFRRAGRQARDGDITGAMGTVAKGMAS